jgi:hypothetical protein
MQANVHKGITELRKSPFYRPNVKTDPGVGIWVWSLKKEKEKKWIQAKVINLC